jgi:TRAP-type mannitol/chloroaromatic compound transport system permease small subunit
MPKFICRYISAVETMNYYIGRMAMYMIFLLIAVLLWSSISKTLFYPSLWTLEVAQFFMVAYYILGGPYSMQLKSNVRMDLFYASWTPRTKALIDAATVFCLVFYLGVLLYGGIESTIYSLKYGERSPSAWRPYMWPIKIVTCFGILLMILQASAEFIRDIATIKGIEISANPAELRGQR